MRINRYGDAMNTTANQTDDMPAEIDFSKGLSGKFYHANTKLNQEVQAYLSAVASERHSTV